MSDPISPDEQAKLGIASQGDAVAVVATEKPKRSRPATVKPTARAARVATKDFEVVAVERRVHTYRLQETELDWISDCNSTSEWFGKATVALVSLVIGLLFDMLIQGTLTEFAKGVLFVVIPIATLGAIFCGCKWRSTYRKVSDFKKKLTKAGDVDLG